ncbi:MAG: DUF412 family protein [Colwellia sp.]
MNVVEIIKLGQQYLTLWPEKPELSQYFVDYKAVQTCRFVCRYFPALALFTFIMQLYFSSGYPLGYGSVTLMLSALPQALVYLIFILSIPVQTLVIMGVKADQFLPSALASWYRSGLDKAKEQGNAVSSAIHEKTRGTNSHHRNDLDNASNQAFKRNESIHQLPVSNPRYIDFAKLLQLTIV